MLGAFGGYGSSSVTFFDENGNPLSAQESAELAEMLANIMIIGGLIALIGGIIFAVVWYKKSKESQQY